MIFSRDLMKDKVRAVGVSGRDLADDDDEYKLEYLKIGPWKKKGLSPPQWATGPCRPRAGRQAPVARWGGDRAFFFQGPHCEFEKNYI